MSTTRERLITAGAALFQANSYQGTGINDILKACGVPKGSFYNYFSSKEDFALAAIEYSMEGMAEFVKLNLCNDKMPPLERISAYIDAAAQGMVDCDFALGCPFGTMAQEMATLSEPLRNALIKAFQVQVDHLAECIRMGKEQQDIKAELDVGETALFIMSAMEGAMIMAKTFRCNRPLHEVRHMIIDVLLPAS